MGLVSMVMLGNEALAGKFGLPNQWGRLGMIGLVGLVTTCASAGTAAPGERFECQRRLAASGIPNSDQGRRRPLDHVCEAILSRPPVFARRIATVSRSTRNHSFRLVRNVLVQRSARRIHALVERSDDSVSARRLVSRMQSRGRVPLRILCLARKIAERQSCHSRVAISGQCLSTRSLRQNRVTVRAFNGGETSRKDEPQSNSSERYRTCPTGGCRADSTLIEGHNVPDMGNSTGLIEFEIIWNVDAGCQEPR